MKYRRCEGHIRKDKIIRSTRCNLNRSQTEGFSKDEMIWAIIIDNWTYLHLDFHY